MNYCGNCGAIVRQGIPEGDHRLRAICDACNMVHYENPRMIVGCVPRWEDSVLLCKRSNEPRKGLWTLPAGFLENGESAEAGASRETMEEANADVEIVRVFSLYSVPDYGQVYLFFLSNLKNTNFSPGVETELTQLFRKDEIPWDEIAFSSVRFTLERFFSKPESEKVHIASHGVPLNQLVGC